MASPERRSRTAGLIFTVRAGKHTPIYFVKYLEVAFAASPRSPSSLRACRIPKRGRDAVTVRSRRRQLRAAALRAAAMDDDQRLAEGGIHRLHELPRAHVRHVEIVRGVADRTVPLDALEQRPLFRGRAECPRLASPATAGRAALRYAASCGDHYRSMYVRCAPAVSALGGRPSQRRSVRV